MLPEITGQRDLTPSEFPWLSLEVSDFFSALHSYVLPFSQDIHTLDLISAGDELGIIYPGMR